jgi:apolipoprotein N-acyltransferase
MHRAGRIDTMAPPADDPTLFAMAGNILPLIFAGLMMVIAVAIGRRQS